MANMGNYCKAYPIDMLQKFPHWSERPVALPAANAADGRDAEPEGRYLFLQENLIVTAGIFLDEAIVFDQITPEWEKFCREELRFEVPDLHETSSSNE